MAMEPPTVLILQARLDQALTDLAQAHAHLSDLRTEPFSAYAVNATLQRTIGQLKSEGESLALANTSLKAALAEANAARVAATHSARLAAADRNDALALADAARLQRTKDADRIALLDTELQAANLRLAQKEVEARILAAPSKESKQSDQTNIQNREWCKNCASLVKLNEDDHAADIAAVRRLKLEMLAESKKVESLEAALAYSQKQLKDEQEAHLKTAHKLAEAEATVASLKLENTQSTQNMQVYMKYSEDQQHLLISHIERMQIFSNRRAEDAAAVISKTRQQFTTSLHALKDLSAVAWLSSSSSSPQPTEILNGMQTKLDGIHTALKSIHETMIANASTPSFLEQSTPMATMFKRNSAIEISEAMLVPSGSTSDNILTPASSLFSDNAISSFMKRIGSTLGLDPDSFPLYKNQPHPSSAFATPNVATPTSKPLLQPTDSDLNMASLSDLEEDKVEEPERSKTNQNSQFEVTNTTLPTMIANLQNAKLSKIARVIEGKDAEIEKLGKEVSKLKRILGEVGGQAETMAKEEIALKKVEKQKQIDDEAAKEMIRNLEFNLKLLSAEKHDLSSKITSLLGRIETLQRNSSQLKGDLESKSIQLEKSELTHQETKSQLKQALLKLETSETQYNAVKSESELLKKRMAQVLKKIEDKTLEIVTHQLNNETSGTSPNNATFSSTLSSLSQSLLSPTSPQTPAQLTTLLTEKESESALLRAHIDKLNSRVTESFHKLRDTETRLVQANAELERLHAVEDMCGWLKREKERVEAEVLIATRRAETFEGGRRRSEGDDQARSVMEEVRSLKASLVRATLESEAAMEEVQGEKRGLEEEVSKQKEEVDRLRRKLQTRVAEISEKAKKINELSGLVSTCQERVNSLEAGSFEKDAKVSSLIEKLKLLEDEKNRALDELSVTKSTLDDVVNKTSSLQAKVNSLEGSINTKDAQYKTLEQLNATLNSENKSLHSKNELSVKELESVSLQLQDVQRLFVEKEGKSNEFARQLSSYQFNVLTLEKKVETGNQLQKCMSDLSACGTKILTLEANVKALENAVADRERKIKSLEAQLSSLYSENGAAVEELSQKTSKLNMTRSELETIQKLLSEKTAKIDELLKQDSTQQKTIYSLEEHLRRNEAKLKALNIENKALVAKLDTHQVEYHSLKQVAQSTSKSLDDLNSSNGAEIARLHSVIKSVKAEREVLVEKLSNKANEINTLQIEFGATQKALFANETRFKEAERELKALQNQVRVLGSTIAEKEARVSELEGSVHSLQEEKTQYSHKLEKKLAEVDSLEKKVLLQQSAIKSVESLLREQTATSKELEKSLLALQSEHHTKMRDRLQSHKALIESLESVVLENDNVLRGSQQNLSIAARDHDLVSNDLVTKVQEIANLKKELHRNIIVLAERDAQLQETSEQLVFHKDKVSSLEAAVAERETSLKTMEKRVKMLAEEKRVALDELSMSSVDLDALIRERDSLKSLVELKEMEWNSTKSSMESVLDETYSKTSRDKSVLLSQLESVQAVNKDMTKKVSEYRQQVLSLEATIAAKDIELNRLGSEFSGLTSSKLALAEDLGQKHCEIEALRFELDSLRNVFEQSKEMRDSQIALHLSQIESLEKSVIEKETAARLLEESLANSVSARGSIVADLESLSRDYAATKDIVSMKEAETPSLLGQIFSLNGLLEDKNAMEKNLREHNAELKDALRILNFESTKTLSSIKDELSSRTMILNQKEAECEELKRLTEIQQKQIEKLNDDIKSQINSINHNQDSELRKKLSQLISSCEELETKLKAKESEASNLQLNFNQIADENNDIMLMVDKIKLEKDKSVLLVNQLSSEKDTLMARLASQDAEIVLLKESYDALSSNFKASFEKLSSADSEIAKLQLEIRTAKAEKQKLETSQLDGSGNIRGRLEKQESEVAILKDTLNASLKKMTDSDALVAANNLIKSLKEEATKQDFVISSLHQENARIKSVYEGLQTDHRSLIESRENLWANLNAKLNELKLLRDEKIITEHALSKLTAEYNTLSENNALLHQVKIDSSNSLLAVKADCEALKESCNVLKLTLESKSRQLDVAVEENKAIVNSNTRLVSEINSLIEERSQLKEKATDFRIGSDEKIKSLMEENATLVVKIQDFESQCQTLSELLKTSSSELKDKTQEYEELLREKSSLEKTHSKLVADQKIWFLELEYAKKERDSFKSDMERISAISKNSEGISSEYHKLVELLEQKNNEALKFQSTLNEKLFELNQLRDLHDRMLLSHDETVSRLKEVTEAQNADLLKLQSEYSLLITENEQYMAVLAQNKSDKARMLDAMAALESRVSTAQSRMLEDQHECRKLREALTSVSAEYERTVLELSNYNIKCSNLSDSLAAVQKKLEVSILNQERDQYQWKNDMETSSAQFQTEKDELNAELTRIRSANLAMEEAVSNLAALLEEKKEELKQTQNRLQELTDGVIRRTDSEVLNIRTYERKNGELKEELIRLQFELSEIRSEKEQLDLFLYTRNQDLKGLQLQIVETCNDKDQLTLNLTSRDQEIKELKTMVSLLQDDLKHTSVALEERNESYHELQAVVSGLTTENERLIDSLSVRSRELSELNERLMGQTEIASTTEHNILNGLTRAIDLYEKDHIVTELVPGNQVMNSIISRLLDVSSARLVQEHSVLLSDINLFGKELAVLLALESFSWPKVVSAVKTLRHNLDKSETAFKSATNRLNQLQEDKESLLSKERDKLRLSCLRIEELETLIDETSSGWRIKCNKLETKTAALQSQLVQKENEALSLEEQLTFELSKRTESHSHADHGSTSDKAMILTPSIRSIGVQSESVRNVDVSIEAKTSIKNKNTQTIAPITEPALLPLSTTTNDEKNFGVHENKVMVDLIAEVSHSRGRLQVLEQDLARLSREKKNLSDVLHSRHKEAARLIKELDTERLFKDSALSETFSLRNKLLEMQQLKDAEIEHYHDADTITSLLLVFQQIVNAQYSLSDYMESKLASLTIENKELKTACSNFDALAKEVEKLHAACDNWSQSYNELRLESNDALEIKMGEIKDLKSVINQKNAELEELKISNTSLTEAVDLVKESDELHKTKCHELTLIISESDLQHKERIQALNDDINQLTHDRDTFELKFIESEKRAQQLSKEWDDSFRQLRIVAAKEKDALVTEHKSTVLKLEERFESEIAVLNKEIWTHQTKWEDLKNRLNVCEASALEKQKEMEEANIKLRKSFDKEAMSLRLEKKKSDSLHTIIQADRDKNSKLQTKLEEYQLRAQTLGDSLNALSAAEQALKKQISFLQSELETAKREKSMQQRQHELRSKRYSESEAYLRKQLADVREEFHQKEMDWVASRSRLEKHRDSYTSIPGSDYQQLLKDKNSLESQVKVLTDTLALKSAEWEATNDEMQVLLSSERALATERDVQLVRLQSDGENDQIERIRRVGQLETENNSMKEKINDLLSDEVQLRRQLVILEADLRTSVLEWEQERKSFEDEISSLQAVSRQQVNNLNAALTDSYNQFQEKQSQWMTAESELQNRLQYEAQRFDNASAEVYRLTETVNSLEYEISNSQMKRIELESHLQHLEKLIDIDAQNMDRLASENTDLRFQLSSSQTYIQSLERSTREVLSPSRGSQILAKNSELTHHIRDIRNTAEDLVSRKSLVSIGTQTTRNAVNRSSMTTSDLLLGFKPPSILNLDHLPKIETGSSIGSSNFSQKPVAASKSVSFANTEMFDEEVEETITYYETRAKKENKDPSHQPKGSTLQSADADLDFIRAATKRSVIGTAKKVQTAIDRQAVK
ncbi:hypothetical protein HDU99_001753 [Rhizoclosmatium hyalinum]|nr:hypothetical protein HDU99_001753 [Rhizoclosmatium hyalinum]